MSSYKENLRELAAHAIAKKGAQQESDLRDLDVLECPCIEVPGPVWGNFLEEGDNKRVRIPVLENRLRDHRKLYPRIREWGAECDGHVYMEIPLDSSVPLEFIKSLIDEGYEIIWNKLSDDEREEIDQAAQPYDEAELLERLVDKYDLKKYRAEIDKLIRPALLLRTKKASRVKTPLGAGKIGGKPDLPTSTAWPLYRDGRPLAFLAQLDLAEIAKLGSPLKGLPQDGLLSVFSAWGWEEDDEPAPPFGDKKQLGWTVVLHIPAGTAMERRETPDGVKAFKAAVYEPIAIHSLPNHRLEPSLAALKWKAALYDRFDEMQSTFRAQQMGHYLKNRDSDATHHLLGGYALFQQEYPQELLKMVLTMFLQIGSDDLTRMNWGDEGELTFYTDAKALAQGRFEGLYGFHQCG